MKTFGFIIPMLVTIALLSCIKEDSKFSHNVIYDLVEYEKTDTLSGRNFFAAASAGNKIILAGGTDGGFHNVVKSVEIYDISTGKSTTSELSQARYFLTGISSGSKVLFAGGRVTDDIYSNIVDIYDVSTQEWTTGHLSEGMQNCTAASIGNKIFFAGGVSKIQNPDVVNIYDVSTNTWSISHLSQGRTYLAIAAAGNKVLFAGGLRQGVYEDSICSNRVDIYDIRTEKWTTSQLSKGRAFLTATSSGNKIFFAGGDDHNSIASDIVDIYDVKTGKWATSQLSKGRERLTATSSNNKIIFAGGSDGGATSDIIDIYDLNTKKWTTSNLVYTSGIVVVPLISNNKLFLTNGKYMDIFKLTKK